MGKRCSNINGCVDVRIKLTVEPQTKNTQTVIAHTNLGNKYGGSWTLAILVVHGA